MILCLNQECEKEEVNELGFFQYYQADRDIGIFDCNTHFFIPYWIAVFLYDTCFQCLKDFIFTFVMEKISFEKITGNKPRLIHMVVTENM